MKWYASPIRHPEAEVVFLLDRYGTKELALRFAEWVPEDLAETRVIRKFWREVIELLKK